VIAAGKYYLQDEYSDLISACAPEGPTISGTKKSGSPGTSLSLSGSYFAPGESLTIYFDGKTVAHVTTDSSGSFTTPVQVPGNATPGSHTWSAIGVVSTPGLTNVTTAASVKFKLPSGVQLWVSRYNGPANSTGGASAVGVSPDGSKLFVTGNSYGASTGYDYATVAYSTR
jgi:hypothetical protein